MVDDDKPDDSIGTNSKSVCISHAPNGSINSSLVMSKDENSVQLLIKNCDVSNVSPVATSDVVNSCVNGDAESSPDHVSSDQCLSKLVTSSVHIECLNQSAKQVQPIVVCNEDNSQSSVTDDIVCRDVKVDLATPVNEELPVAVCDNELQNASSELQDDQDETILFEHPYENENSSIENCMKSDEELSIASSSAEQLSDHCGFRPVMNEVQVMCVNDPLKSSPMTPVKHFLDGTDETDLLLEKLETELGDNGRKLSYHSQEDTGSRLSASTSRSSLTEGGITVDDDKYKLLFDHYELQIEVLEKKNGELQHELALTKEKVHQQELEFQNRSSQMRSEMLGHVEKLNKQVESKKKDLESMVVRYAKSEQEMLIHKKIREDLERRLRDAGKERDNLINKIKVLNVERARVSSSLDNKLAEVASIQKDNEWLKEEVNSRDIKIKWLQNKLKTEADSHKECQMKLEQTLKRLNETKEEAEQIRKECQSMVSRYQQAEEMKALKLNQENAKMEPGEKQEDGEQQEILQVKQELEVLKKKHKLSIEENNALTVKIQSLERDRLDYEQTVSKLKEVQISLQQEIADLNNKLVETESLKMQLEREREKVATSQKEVSRLKLTNAELQADVESCHGKEGELLEFTEKLTAKTVSLQSEHSLLEAKAQNLEQQLSRMTKKCSELEAQKNSLKTNLEEMEQQHQQETQLLARKLAEKTKALENLNVKLTEAKSENNVIMKRHVTSIRELTRELHLVKKKLNAYEAQNSGIGGDAASLSSRTSSTNSLDVTANPHQMNHVHQTSATATNSSVSTGAVNQHRPTREPPDSGNSSHPEISKQMLIERIGILQKSMARKNEKIEFLKELVNQLQTEIKKKTRIVQNYVLREEAGTLASCMRDRVRAPSTYGCQVPDPSSMTLELSLEINSKLQAVLEDMILKNITLKENINTLGEEIARMSKEQRQ